MIDYRWELMEKKYQYGYYNYEIIEATNNVKKAKDIEDMREKIKNKLKGEYERVHEALDKKFIGAAIRKYRYTRIRTAQYELEIHYKKQIELNIQP